MFTNTGWSTGESAVVSVSEFPEAHASKPFFDPSILKNFDLVSWGSARLFFCPGEGSSRVECGRTDPFDAFLLGPSTRDPKDASQGRRERHGESKGLRRRVRC